MVYFTNHKTGKSFVYKVLRDDEVLRDDVVSEEMREYCKGKAIIGCIESMYDEDRNLIRAMYTWCIDDISMCFDHQEPTWVCPD